MAGDFYYFFFFLRISHLSNFLNNLRCSRLLHPPKGQKQIQDIILSAVLKKAKKTIRLLVLVAAVVFFPCICIFK